jgi:hypothetical protein
MKHLRKFNESFENEHLDIEYIKHCFADLSDDPECDVEYDTHEDYLRDNPNYGITLSDEYVDLTIDIPRITKGVRFERMIVNSERITHIVKSIDVAIKRLKDEYPNYNIEINYEEDDDRPNDYLQININNKK